MISKVSTSKLWMVLTYLVSLVYLRLIPYSAKKSAGKSLAESSSTLIYSEAHFDPETDSLAKAYSNSSAANLARHLYKVLKAHTKSVTYLDGHKPVKLTPSDLTLGILSKNFIKDIRENSTGQKILFLVNSHPLYRNAVVLKESLNLRKKLIYYEWANPLDLLRIQNSIDTFILIGNAFVKQTFIDRGIPADRIFLIDSGVNIERLKPNYQLRPKTKLRILAPGSHLAIRKGLFRILDLWIKIPVASRQDMELIIVGRVNPFEKDVEAFEKAYPGVSFKGWVDSSQPEYLHLFQSSHVVLSYSLEEGQVGAILEAMACGAIAIVTNQSGISIVEGKNGFIEPDITSPEKTIKLLIQLAKNPDMISKLSNQSVDFIHRNHTWEKFESQVAKIILSSNGTSRKT